MQLTKEQKKRFWSKVLVNNGCWEWTGSQFNIGYGRFFINKKHQLAHRIMWQLCHGIILKGMCICHSCDNPSCVNPKHLWLGSHKDNMDDRDEKGRQKPACGEQHGFSKLTEKQILVIRKEYQPWGKSYRELAKRYNLHHSTIIAIVKRRTWKHI